MFKPQKLDYAKIKKVAVAIPNPSALADNWCTTWTRWAWLPCRNTQPLGNTQNVRLPFPESADGPSEYGDWWTLLGGWLRVGNDPIAPFEPRVAEGGTCYRHLLGGVVPEGPRGQVCVCMCGVCVE